ncbi:hypothetical protein BLOT_016027 [Blomia tropicalis]|nr:hypothetical protein BLOT_016027 [Blomia tropicalis]
MKKYQNWSDRYLSFLVNSTDILRDMKRQMGRLSSTCKSFGFAYSARAESWVSEIVQALFG